jgi:hypothetical protein
VAAVASMSELSNPVEGRAKGDSPAFEAVHVEGSIVSNRNKALIALTVALGVLVYINFDLLVGRTNLRWDAVDVFAPSFVLLSDFVHKGQLMLWNPWMDAGTPEWIEPQLGAFSPIMMGFGLLFGGEGLAFRLYFLTIWWLSGLGVFLLGRRFRLPVYGAATLGFAWIFSGFSMGNAQHVSMIYSMAWLPFEILVLDQALERGSWRRFAALGALWGFSMLGGYPGIAMSNWLLLSVWSLGRSLWPAANSPWASYPVLRRLGKAFVGLSVAGLIGVVVFGPNLIGMLWEGAGITRRSGALPRSEVVGADPLSPLCLVTLANSYLSTLSRPRLWPPTDASMVNVYLGAPALAFAAMALFQGRRWVRWGLLVTLILFFAVALGPSFPLRGWLYDFVPTTRFQHHPALFRCQAMMLLMVLALLGARDFFADRIRRGLPTVVALGLGVLSVGLFYRLCSMAKTKPSDLGLMHVYAVWGGCVVAMVLKDFLPRSRPRLRTLAWMAVLLPTVVVDAYFTNRLAVTNLDANPRFAQFMRELPQYHNRSLDLKRTSGFRRSAMVDGHGAVPRWSGWSGVFKEPVYYGYTALVNPYLDRLAKVPEERALSAGDRKIWFSTPALAAPPSDGLLDGYIGRWREQKNAPLILHEARDFKGDHSPTAAMLSSLRSANAMTPLEPQLLAYTPRHLEFQVTAPADGWILVTDRWSRGWRATVNGTAALISPANFYFRAVFVKAGLNTVKMDYQPLLVHIALALSWGTLLVVALLQFRKPRRRVGAVAS